MPEEQIISGKIIIGAEPEVIEGYICLKNGIISEIGEEKVKTNNIISPCFVNSHTHIGDSVFKDPIIGNIDGYMIKKDLDSIVKPPYGLKHKILQQTTSDKLIEYMKKSIDDMTHTGTYAFGDFREGGISGALALKKALLNKSITGKIFGRISDCNIPHEVYELLEICHGLGVSGTRDIPNNILSFIREAAYNKHKPFFIHAGEKDDSDVQDALNIDPDVLIHLTHAQNTHFKQIVDEAKSIVVCPRSNFITGVGIPNIKKMLEFGTNVGVGSDNVMFNAPNMFIEMELLVKFFGIDDRQVFKMCTLNGASILGLKNSAFIKKGSNPKMMLIDGASNNLSGITDPIRGIVRRARPDDIITLIN